MSEYYIYSGLISDIERKVKKKIKILNTKIHNLENENIKLKQEKNKCDILHKKYDELLDYNDNIKPSQIIQNVIHNTIPIPSITSIPPPPNVLPIPREDYTTDCIFFLKKWVVTSNTYS